MNQAEMENRIQTLEQQVKTLQTLLDIEEIKKLQRIYGYYLEHWMAQEIIDLFSDAEDASLDFEWYEGKYIGKASIRRYYEGRFKTEPGLLHQLMQLCPVIDVSSDGLRAWGRWYGFGEVAAPRGEKTGESIMNGIYENEYVKENGKWKFKHIRWAMNYMAIGGLGIVPPEQRVVPEPGAKIKMSWPEPDEPPREFVSNYPSGYILPFHYRNPVTGRKSSEEENNKTVKGIENA